ncbi:MAG: arginine--tRNA ligase [Rickettsiales bacterium]|jgi:arginyl-tRNA synthetase|nr:arginine--tRNA ligase [Rickettsiales bacterium]
MTFHDSVLSAVRTKLGINDLILEVPKEKSFGDFATNIAMQLAKAGRKNPREIAEGFLPKLREIGFIESAEIAGAGFVNIRIKNDFITECAESFEVARFVHPNPLTIDMDYGAYNVAKELHIGHLRTSIVGDTLYRIARFLGHRPISYNHMGDWGKPMALVIARIKRKFPDDWDDPDFKIDETEFNGYYPDAAKLAREDPEFLAEVLRIKKEFQDGNPEYFALYEKFLKISMDMMDDVVRRLNIIPFDNNLGERNAAKHLAPVEKILRDKKLLTVSDGATIVELKRGDDTAPMPPLMFFDSRGADTYDSTDLAAMYYRKITDRPDILIYLTDVRQKLHFEQLFRVAEMSGIFPADVLEHQYFGSINGADGRPYRTRNGNVASLFDIIDMVENAARGHSPELPEETVKMIALAALKFNDLMHDMKGDYIFDPAAVVRFEGRTGPYVLYTAVRLNSILKKEQRARSRKTEIRITSPHERDLLLKILDFPRTIQAAFDRRTPDMLANYTYELCQCANGFYHNCPVIGNAGRAAVTRKAAETLGKCIELMGLRVPPEM